MSIQAPHSDADLLDLLRIAGPLRVTEMADAMEVTATAVRQRLVRLLARGFIQREAIRAGRGRPRHSYWLTDKGIRQTGSNFNDLAVALWSEVQSSGDRNLRREMLRRIAQALAAGYRGQIHGETPSERLQSLRDLLAQRRIPASVDASNGTVTLTTHACPYPSLADQDRSVCDMEELLFSDLVGADVELSHCRLDGGGECKFHVKGMRPEGPVPLVRADRQRSANGNGSAGPSSHDVEGEKSPSA
ncbi:MAG: helix-turn-helix transcriptional regulator [Planctomycetota bacterium]